jgi:hypothetical protein
MTRNQEGVPARAQVALLIDGDHIPPKVVGQAIEKAETVGSVAIRRVYANWHGVPKNWREILNRYQVTHMRYDPPPKGTNATDITLVVDALKLFYRDGIRHFCLVACDSDYTALVWELRREGCVILGIGEAQITPSTLQQACSSFVLTKQLPPVTQPVSTSKSPSKKATTASKKTNKTAKSRYASGAHPRARSTSIELPARSRSLQPWITGTRAGSILVNTAVAVVC